MEVSEAAPVVLVSDTETPSEGEPSSASLLDCKEEILTPEVVLIPTGEHTLEVNHDEDKEDNSDKEINEVPGSSEPSAVDQLQVYKALQTYALTNLISAAQQNVTTNPFENLVNHNGLSSNMLTMQSILNMALYRQMLSNVVASQSPYMSLLGTLLTRDGAKPDNPGESSEKDSEPVTQSEEATTSVLASLLRGTYNSSENSTYAPDRTKEQKTRENKVVKGKAKRKGSGKKDGNVENVKRKEEKASRRRSSTRETRPPTRASNKRKSLAREVQEGNHDKSGEEYIVPTVYVKEEPDSMNTLKKFRKANAIETSDVEAISIKSEIEIDETSLVEEGESLDSYSSSNNGSYRDSIIENSFYAGNKPRRKYKKRPPKDGEFEKEKKYSCSVCGKMFKLEASVAKHMWLHTGEQPYSCTICEKKFTEKSNLTTHMRIHTGEKPHGCSICGRRFTQQASLMYHIRSHTGEKPYQCKICKKSFVSSSGLNSHMISHSTYKPFKCDICDNSFARKSGLDLHMMVHTGEKPYECKHCGKLFTQRGALTNHQKQHTGDRRFHCEVCGKTFVDNCTLKKHMRIHSGEMPYQCELCGKRFLHRTSHIEHMKVHNDERTYPCPVCGKLFRNKSSVNTHMVTHTKEKPHECEECGKRFALKSNLKHHVKIHVGNREFVCEVCGQAFLFKDTLREHFKTHTGEKTYVCQLCGKGYMWKPSFLRHMDEVHGMNPDDHWEVFANARGRYKRKVNPSPNEDIPSVLLSSEEQNDSIDEEEEDKEEVTTFDFAESNDILGCQDAEAESNIIGSDGDGGTEQAGASEDGDHSLVSEVTEQANTIDVDEQIVTDADID